MSAFGEVGSWGHDLYSSHDMPEHNRTGQRELASSSVGKSSSDTNHALPRSPLGAYGGGYPEEDVTGFRGLWTQNADTLHKAAQNSQTSLLDTAAEKTLFSATILNEGLGAAAQLLSQAETHANTLIQSQSPTSVHEDQVTSFSMTQPTENVLPDGLQAEDMVELREAFVNALEGTTVYRNNKRVAFETESLLSQGSPEGQLYAKLWTATFPHAKMCAFKDLSSDQRTVFGNTVFSLDVAAIRALALAAKSKAKTKQQASLILSLIHI